jgi:pyridoxal phosphate enzyme (YggS family)
MNPLEERIAALRERLAAAASAAGRDAASVHLLAVSKTFGAEHVIEAASLGLRAFGENRVQEAEEKIPAVGTPGGAQLEWHLIGRLQRNKARRAAALFDVIQSVDRPELARTLSKAAGELGRRPRVLLQIDVDGEPQKGGTTPEAAPALADEVAALPHLELVGLMTIPRARADAESQRPAFARLRTLAEELKLRHPGLTELSMGMTADFEVAIAEGATWVRLGTAVFGQRSAE